MTQSPYRSADFTPVPPPPPPRSRAWGGWLSATLVLVGVLAWRTKRPTPTVVVVQVPLALAAPSEAFETLRGVTRFIGDVPCVATAERGLFCWHQHSDDEPTPRERDGQRWSVAQFGGAWSAEVQPRSSPRDLERAVRSPPDWPGLVDGRFTRTETLETACQIGADIGRRMRAFEAIGRVVDFVTHANQIYCAVNEAGEGFCWGRGECEVQKLALSNEALTAVAVTASRVCAIDRAHRVFCTDQRADTPQRYAPLRNVYEMPTLRGAQAIQGIGPSMCALTEGGEVRCWSSDLRSLGRGTLLRSERPYRVDGLAGVQQVAVGQEHACALTDVGTVRCWGWGYPSDRSGELAAFVGSLSGIAQIGVDDTHSCARSRAGVVVCWGASRAPWHEPEASASETHGRIALPHAAVEIAVGSVGACARLADETVWCWNDLDHRVAHPVTAVVGAQQLTARGPSTCALERGGGVLCWGAELFPRVGNPWHVAPFAQPMRTISIGQQGRVCGLQTDGRTACANAWQSARDQSDPAHVVPLVQQALPGNLDAPPRISHRRVLAPGDPSITAGLRGVASVSYSDTFGCAVHTDGTLSCWGNNDAGQLGREWSDPMTPAPVRVFANP